MSPFVAGFTRGGVNVLRWLAVVMLVAAASVLCVVASVLLFLLLLTCCAAWALIWPARELTRPEREATAARADLDERIASVRWHVERLRKSGRPGPRAIAENLLRKLEAQRASDPGSRKPTEPYMSPPPPLGDWWLRKITGAGRRMN